MNALSTLLDRLGLALPAETVGQLVRYRELLLEANLQFNLTAITERDEVDERLIAESLALLPLIPQTATSLLDIGSGGGIPGMPLAIARPDLQVTLLDATAKKVRFLDQTTAALGLSNVTPLWGRAEELAHDRRYREQYDVVTARAVARLTTLVEYALPFARLGGTLIFPKGAGVGEELQEAEYAITTLGGKVMPVHPPATVVINKVRHTPQAYPRRAGRPVKRPLLAP